MRPFISDGMYERFTLQIAEQRDEGYRNILENVTIQSIDVAEVIVDEQFQWLTVRVRASAIDYRVDIASGKEISGSRRPEDFTEFWTFLRRNHAKTKVNQAGLIEGDCPNCGATIELATTARCGSCDSLLRSGQHDRVLCAITQASEWDAAQAEADAVVIRTAGQAGRTMCGRRAIKFDKDNDFDTKNACASAVERYSFGWSDWRGIFGTPGN